MIRLLFKQIWKQRSVNVWLWMELMVVFVCLAYVVDYLYMTTERYLLPLGFDTEHVYRVYLSKVSPNSEAYVADEPEGAQFEQMQTIMQRMRAFPGVEAVSATTYGPPYDRGYSNGSRGIDTVWVHGHMNSVSPPFFEVFRISDVHGQIKPLVTAAMEGNTVIISRETERKFALEGVSALGNGLKGWGEEVAKATVRAICEDVRFDDFSIVYPVYYNCQSEEETLRSRGPDATFCVRVNPEADNKEFLSTFRKEMSKQLRIGNIYLMDVTSYKDIRDNYYRSNGTINQVKTYLAGFSFLLLNIFMGVIGTFWIRTQQRRSEIGLHIALGATHESVRAHLLFEGTLLLLLAVIPACVISGNLIYLDIFGDTYDSDSVFQRFATGHLITLFVLWIMIMIGIYFPSRQVLKVHPAEALHNE